MKKIIVLLLGCMAILIACSKSGGVTATIDCSGAAKSWASDVSPLIQSFCATSGCHAVGSNNGPGALTTYQQVFNNRSSIRNAVVSGSMPQNSRLSSAQINAIVCWIDNGATNN
jgi:hypothetical protein